MPLIFHRAVSSSMSNDYGGIDSDSERNLLEQQRRRRMQLHPPGRLLHLSVSNGSLVKRWTDYNEFDEIKLSGAVISDHMPYYVRKVLAMDSTANLLHDV
ncbi:unnamed protein product [Anisakis simplex]|uniref:Uncharacterized protein n=1 Tax=Anisakis simplex TaxID=6269 RepID=A0A3P6S066_ANISI|nr:unnamed protein product [Anisakis simplex]